METRTSVDASEEVLVLTSVELEVPIGHVRPDLLVSWVDEVGHHHSMMIEVTVTNTITSERIDRLSSLGWPVLEIDISRMGGTVTRSEFENLVVDEVAGKCWLYHPEIASTEYGLIEAMKAKERRDIDAAARRRVDVDVWAQRFLSAFLQRSDEERLAEARGKSVTTLNPSQETLTEAISALIDHGLDVAAELEQAPLRNIVARTLSIKLGTGIGYKYDNAWQVINAIRCDQEPARKWHTLYLAAIRVYTPTLTPAQQTKVDEWRATVKTSLEMGEATYRRPGKFDRLLGLLFPELKPLLAKPLPRPSQGKASAPKQRQESYFRRNGPVSMDAYLRGTDFEDWARRNPEAAKRWVESEAGRGFQLPKARDGNTEED